jgi:signal transduction histidine kinase
VKSLYAKLAWVLIASFAVIGGGLIFIYAMAKMLTGKEVEEIVLGLIAAMLVFLIVMAVAMHFLVTRRLGTLAQTMQTFQQTDFKQAPNLPSLAAADNDEISRLSAAFAGLSARVTEQLQQLAQNDANRRDLLANVSHDLRTPLASIKGYLETILLKQRSLDANEMRNYLEVAARQCDRLHRLVNDLFQLTKLEAKDITLQREAFSIAELAQDVAQKFALKIEAQGLRMETDLAADLPLVDGDVGMIERCLDNLIENAIRHTPSGGLLRLTLERSGAADGVKTRLSDTGQGIDARDLGRIFDRYYQADRNEVGAGGGAGLGLAITKHILELHGSRIEVESQVGKGTAFSFVLPAARAFT